MVTCNRLLNRELLSNLAQGVSQGLLGCVDISDPGVVRVGPGALARRHCRHDIEIHWALGIQADVSLDSTSYFESSFCSLKVIYSKPPDSLVSMRCQLQYLVPSRTSEAALIKQAGG